jgi:putative hydroxymethylpyrimidine transport system permease protein
MKAALSASGVVIILVGIWQAVSLATGLPAYILPTPAETFTAGWSQRDFIASNALVTLSEMVLGFLAGSLLGIACALAMATAAPLRLVLRPVLIASQAIPVFALAPLFVVWLGYGITPKIAIAALVIFFPVAIAFTDGLRRTPVALLESARVMAGPGHRLAILRHIAIPAAMPSLATGLRLGAGVAAIAAVIGEWAGASSGLGYLMLWANSRTQVPLMFAALITLFALAIAFSALVDLASRRLTPWLKETD